MLSSLVSDLNSTVTIGGVKFNFGFNTSQVGASCAFAWLTFFVWTASTALSVMEILKGRSGGGAPAAPEAPAVAMV